MAKLNRLVTGAPVSGTSGTLVNVADPGDLLVAQATGNLYVNTNTKASPTWTFVAASAPASLTVANGLTVTAGGETITAGGLTISSGLTQMGSGTRTATATGTGGTSTVTLNKESGIITTDAITTAAAAEHVMTVTNSLVTASSIIVAMCDGTTSAGAPIVRAITPGSGSFTITIRNIHASAALNAAIKIMFVVLA